MTTEATLKDRMVPGIPLTILHLNAHSNYQLQAENEVTIALYFTYASPIAQCNKRRNINAFDTENIGKKHDTT